MEALREDLPALPTRMHRLHVRRGYPVPWFVTWMKDGEVCDAGEGEPEFRVITSERIKEAVDRKLCWVCGEKMGTFYSFTAGPMCAVNQISAEPPSHRDCARFSAKGCPFLTRPHMRRRENDLPTEDERVEAGKMILRNPGVAMVWTTKHFRPISADEGVVFRMGSPTGIDWYHEGGYATTDQVLDSIRSGLPILNEGEPEPLAVLNSAAAARLEEMVTSGLEGFSPRG